MTRLVFHSIAVCVVLTSFLLPAAAQEAMPQQGDRVEIVTDQQAGAVRIVIDGREAARIDATGLRVHGNIEYGGTVTDTGPADYDRRAAQAGSGQDAE